MFTTEDRKIPEKFGGLLAEQLHGAKVSVKHQGVKHRGRITSAAFSNGTIKISLDNKIDIIELDMKSYLKVF